MSTLEEWWRNGQSNELLLSGAQRRIFVRTMGSGPWLTLLHGFPSSSHDWAGVAPALAQRHALLMPDLLGFGASQKPADHVYSLDEQADLVQALWAAHGVAETALVAHDYSVSVAQELLARDAEGTLGVRLRGVHLLNGGVYPELHRPQPTQSALLDPELGPKVGAMLSEELFVAAMAPTFAESFDAAGASREIWRATSREHGHLISHLLIRYITDREAHGGRWVAALEQSEVRRSFVWGMLDPVSGAHMAERIRERMPDAPFMELKDTGHWPPLEAPERLAAAVLQQD